MANNITTAPVKISNGGGVALQVVGAGTVYVGQNPTDPTIAGLALTSAQNVVYMQDTHGPLYAMTSTGTVDLRVLSL